MAALTAPFSEPELSEGPEDRADASLEGVRPESRLLARNLQL